MTSCDQDRNPGICGGKSRRQNAGPYSMDKKPHHGRVRVWWPARSSNPPSIIPLSIAVYCALSIRSGPSADGVIAHRLSACNTLAYGYQMATSPDLTLREVGLSLGPKIKARYSSPSRGPILTSAVSYNIYLNCGIEVEGYPADSFIIARNNVAHATTFCKRVLRLTKHGANICWKMRPRVIQS